VMAHGRKGVLGQTLDPEFDESKSSKERKKDKAEKAEKKGSDSLAGSMEPGMAGMKSKSGGGRVYGKTSS
jgi:hypothetical protein